MSSSAAVNALVNPGSSGYRCRSRRTFGCLFGTLPLSRSWCATWLAVVLQCCVFVIDNYVTNVSVSSILT